MVNFPDIFTKSITLPTFDSKNNLNKKFWLKIESGPFTEFIGHVDKIEENQRAWILIEILKQQTRAKVARSNLSKVS